eukprot:Skav236559  [mRNA]  locus=scaffold1066:231265:239660:- [translate_table: standard]
MVAGPQLSPTSGHKRFARGAFALTQMKIRGLRPSTTYYFQVQACNQIGASEWSPSSLPMKMGSCAPAKCAKPQFLSGNVRDGMTLYWQAMMKEHRLVENVKLGSYAAAAASSDSHAPAPVPAAPAVPGGFEIKIQRIDGSSLRVEVQPDMCLGGVDGLDGINLVSEVMATQD